MSYSILFYHNSELKFIFDKKEKTKGSILEYLVKKTNPRLSIEQFQTRYIENISQLYKDKKTKIGQDFYKIEIITNNKLIINKRYTTQYQKIELKKIESKKKLSLVELF